jgi:hypothetical protein
MVDEQAIWAGFIDVLKLDSGYFKSKITAYGEFAKTKKEKEKT